MLIRPTIPGQNNPKGEKLGQHIKPDRSKLAKPRKINMQKFPSSTGSSFKLEVNN